MDDQVVRMQRMLEEHPQIEIKHFRHPMFHFRAVWYDTGLRHEISAGELEDLLDMLEERLEGTST